MQHLGDAGAYAAALMACRSGAAWQTALAILQEAGSARVQPDTVCRNAAVSAITRATELSKALMTSDLAGEVANFNSLIMSLRHVPTSWQNLFHVLEQMQHQKISADVGTLKAAASICGKARPDLVLGLWRQLQLQRVQPDIVAVNMLVASLEKIHHWQAALHQLDLCGRTGLKPELITYNAVISACSKAMRWATAVELAAMMASAALMPDEITTSSLITACSRGRWLLALQLLASSRGRSPNLIAVHSAVTACDTAGQWMWSLHVLADASAMRLRPDTLLLGAVLSSFEKAQQWTLSLALLSQMASDGVSPDVALLTSAISACAKAHLWEMTLVLTHQAHAVFGFMVPFRVIPVSEVSVQQLPGVFTGSFRSLQHTKRTMAHGRHRLSEVRATTKFKRPQDRDASAVSF